MSLMASTVLRGPVLRRAARSAAAAKLSGVESATAALQRRSLSHYSTRGNQTTRKSSLDECDALYEVVRGTKVTLLKNDILERIVESCSNARAEFVQNGMERTWMVCAATAGGFFAGCFMRAWKIDKEKMNNEGGRGRDRAEETYDIL